MKQKTKRNYLNMKYIIPALLSIVLLSACYPDYGLGVNDYRTVVTVYDTAADFTTLHTYYLIDSVYHLTDSGALDDITRKYDQRLLSGVAAQFNSYGWTRVVDTTGAAPDCMVRVTASTATTVGYYYNWYPYYGYGGGWWGYPGWGYPYYPPYGGTSYYSYSTGSVFVSLDRFEPPATQTDSLRIRPLWLGSSNGLLSSSESENVTLITYSMQQMFRQSPYLILTTP